MVKPSLTDSAGQEAKLAIGALSEINVATFEDSQLPPPQGTAPELTPASGIVLKRGKGGGRGSAATSDDAAPSDTGEARPAILRALSPVPAPGLSTRAGREDSQEKEAAEQAAPCYKQEPPPHKALDAVCEGARDAAPEDKGAEEETKACRAVAPEAQPSNAPAAAASEEPHATVPAGQGLLSAFIFDVDAGAHSAVAAGAGANGGGGGGGGGVEGQRDDVYGACSDEMDGASAEGASDVLKGPSDSGSSSSSSSSSSSRSSSSSNSR